MSTNYYPLCVLIVDDHAFTRLLLREILQSLGFRKENVIEAEEGHEGLQLMAERKFDVVICDWQMHPMDGLTFVRALRDPERSKNPYVPIIFCSAFTERELIERARDVGVTEIMTKPVTVKAVKAKIEGIFNRPREFVEKSQYFGPDRRRRAGPDRTTGERRRGTP
jgi:two-component system, chemotaxis family, chemotaxis protein CheY